MAERVREEAGHGQFQELASMTWETRQDSQGEAFPTRTPMDPLRILARLIARALSEETEKTQLLDGGEKVLALEG